MEDTIYRSAQVDKINGALARAQGTYKKPVENEPCPEGKYANLEAIIDAVRGSLSENEIRFNFHTEREADGDGAQILKATLGHSSGQYLASIDRVILGETERRIGNLLEIRKRRQACMLLGIAPSKHDPMMRDDNGKEDSELHLSGQLRKPNIAKKEVDRGDVISNDQYQELLIELDGYPDIAKEVMEVENIETLADLPRSRYHQAQVQIRKIKRNDQEYGKNKR